MADGGGSTVLAIASEADVPLAETQKQLTPLQRMVITMTLEEAQDEAGAQQGPARNSLAAGSAGGPGPSMGGNKLSGETVTYVNEGTNNGE